MSTVARYPQQQQNNQDDDSKPPANLEQSSLSSASSKFGAKGNWSSTSWGQSDNTGQGHRKQGAIRTSNRRIARSQRITHPTNYNLEARAEIDSRADTVCGGATFELYSPTGKIVDVNRFHVTMDTIKNVQIGTLITAIDLKDETIIAVFHQRLFFRNTMEHSLIPPAQLWDNDIIVDITPRSKSNGKSIHGIYSPDDEVHIPFDLHGCITYFPTRLPTDYDKDNCRWITLTSEREWDPYSDHFRASEQAAINHYKDPNMYITKATTMIDGTKIDGRTISAVHTTYNSTITSNIVTPELPLTTYDEIRHISATSSKIHRSQQDPVQLARQWGTSTDIAKQTLQTTTQR